MKTPFNNLLEAMRLPSEQKLQTALERHSAIGVQPHVVPFADGNVRFKLEQSCLVVKSRQIKDLQGRLDNAFQRLGFQLHAAITIIPDSGYNAFVLENPFDRTLVMGVNSGLLEDFTPHELLFVLGHETGHYLYGHTEYNRQLAARAEHLPDTHPYHLYLKSLCRRQEVSCDRLGLLCCGNFEYASSALIKAMTQSRCKNLLIEPGTSFHDSSQPLYRFFDAHLDGYAPWKASHPSLVIRGMVLRDLNEATKISTGISQGVISRELQEVNQRCESLLDTMEIDSLKDKAAVRQLHICIIALCKMVARLSDKNCKQMAIINQLIEKFGLTGKEAARQTWPDEVYSFFLMEASPGRRLRVIDLLLSIAMQNHESTSRQFKIIEKISQAMEVPEVRFYERLKTVRERMKALNAARMEMT